MPRKLGNGLVIHGLSQFRGITHEEVGLLVRSGDDVRIIAVENTASDPKESYEVSIESINEVQGCLDEDEYVIGIIHTHLAHHPAKASSRDVKGASENPNALHLIYKPSTGELIEYGFSQDVKPRRKVVRRKNGRNQGSGGEVPVC
jgi:proteasome lid subunit RPN8/RPN11